MVILNFTFHVFLATARNKYYDQCTTRHPCGVNEGSCLKDDERCNRGLRCSTKEHFGCNKDAKRVPNVFCCIGKLDFITILS